MLTATRKEWNELYVLFALLAKGELALGNIEGKASDRVLPIAQIIRQEHDGERKYTIQGDTIQVTGVQMDECFPREDFSTVASMILALLKKGGEEELESPDGVEGFLDALKIFDLVARTDDRTSFYIALHDTTFPPVGLRIQSRLCGYTPLLDGGRTANLKLELTGIRFSGPTVNKINYTEDEDNPDEVGRRMMYIESLGGTLKYADVADKVFRANLAMIDLNLGRVLAEMCRAMQLDNITRIDELTAVIEDKNPLKIKEEMVRKHGYYRHKIKELLVALALGMRPAKQYTGAEGAVEGYVMVDATGSFLLYRKQERSVLADFLFSHTRLEKSSPAKDKFGCLERENRMYYFKLNLKIGLTKK